jgi:hypothetical protein
MGVLVGVLVRVRIILLQDRREILGSIQQVALKKLVAAILWRISVFVLKMGSHFRYPDIACSLAQPLIADPAIPLDGL